MKIKLLTKEQVLILNRMICEEQKTDFHCFDQGKIESALHSAFYPGAYPFIHGGIHKVAGALCYYLCMAHAFKDGNKRVGVASALIFLKINKRAIQYPVDKDKDKDIDVLADLILNCASGMVRKDEMMEWFENHKVKADQ